MNERGGDANGRGAVPEKTKEEGVGEAEAMGGALAEVEAEVALCKAQVHKVIPILGCFSWLRMCMGMRVMWDL
ncbi:hypothetical protein CLOM_g21672 [Closterium sp. NIES-68]|nr:hypothetical protein CLOM_g21672 [Closterium sp. NIES-68]